MFQLHMGIQKCAKQCLKMSRNDDFGCFLAKEGGKWVGVAEHTLAHPHVKFEHDTTLHSLICNEIF